MNAINKSQMDASINKKSTTKKASSSIPNPILGKSTGKLCDDSIGKRSTGSKLSSLMGKR
jgi:hypothetical protein